MTDFEQQLSKAIERGKQRGETRAQDAAIKALSEEEYKQLHSKFRLSLSEHIEGCLKKLPEHFPGFQFETIVGDSGWGASVSRDDVGPGSDGRRDNFYSRLEMVIRKFNEYHVLDLAAKGAIRNKETFTRSHFQLLDEVDETNFEKLIDLWVIEYAELYAAKS